MAKDTIKLENKGKTLMVAHQGLFVVERGNSIPAFRDMAKRSHFGAECDIHVTKDKRIVVNHDNDIGSTCDRSMVIEESLFDDVRAAKIKPFYPDDAPHSEEDMHIPTLSEYIELCRSGEKYCIVELKNHFEKEDVIRVIEEIKALDYLHMVIFISFDLQNCITIRELLPEQPVQYLVVHYTKEVLETLDRYNLDLDMHYHHMSGAVIREVQAHGHKINAWTIDDPIHAQYFISWGIDYITTNYLE